MLLSRFETQPGRANEFFILLRYVAIVIAGPFVASHHSNFEDSLVQHFVLAAFAGFLEIIWEQFFCFIDAIRFCYYWTTRRRPRRHYRRLRSFNLPNFIVPVRNGHRGVERIRKRGYVRIILIAIALLGLIFVPQIVLHFIAIRRKAELEDTVLPSTKEELNLLLSGLTKPESVIMAISLFFSAAILSGGSFLVAAFFAMEHLFNAGFFSLRGHHIRIILYVLYGSWLLFQTFALGCRIWVHLSPNPELRALATIYLFKVTTDTVVGSNEQRCARNFGRIDVGAIYINLREYRGTVTVSFGAEKSTEEVSLGRETADSQSRNSIV